MSNKSRRRLKSKSSKQYCQERFACSGERVEAFFECEDCRSLQCEACEAKLHEIAKYALHDRHRIPLPDSEKLCQSESCDKRNYFDVKCQNCTFNYCWDCFDKLHKQGRKRSHKYLTVKEIQDLEVKRLAEIEAKKNSPLTQAQLDLEIDENFYSIAQNPAILPSSPVGTSSRQLTYPTRSPTQPQPQENKTESKKEDNQMSGTTDRSRSTLPDIATIGSIGSDREAESLEEFHTMMQFQENEKSTSGLKLSLDDMVSLDLDDNTSENQLDNVVYGECRSFLLADGDETLKVSSAEDFIKKLRCGGDQEVKVVSIFGNTGDGKSHSLNHAFFSGKEIFKTSSHQTSCTVGIWAAYDPVHEAVIIDTEGLLGISPNQNQRTRLLLKVLALSDVVLYRTKADRLHADLFRFLGDAAEAFSKHFTQELKAASERLKMHLTKLGPSVVIFHETQHTDVLGKSPDAERRLREKFLELHLNIEAFSSLEYVGVQTQKPPTDFRPLRATVKLRLKDKSVRSPRKVSVIFSALKVLNEKFSGNIDKAMPSTFPDEYFTCQDRCLSCNARCSGTMNHAQDKTNHQSEKRCVYQNQFENKIFKCRLCCDRGNDHVVVPKTASSKDNAWMALVKNAWSGYVLECPQCGVIYRSRQHWYGNDDPESKVVKSEVRHVWPGENQVLQGTHNAARRLLDGIQYVTESIASVSAKPTKMVTDWVIDKIAPPYWVPNSQISNCMKCEKRIGEDRVELIHHCRACGQGFCDECSSKKKPVPERGWGMDPVRVCDNCFEKQTEIEQRDEEGNKVTSRYVTETISSSVGAVASVVKYPKGLLLDSARPAYWKPDHEIQSCCVCRSEFGPKLWIHHCRACGQGVCDNCSQAQRAVPSRGWDHPVRVCDSCNKKKGEL